MMNELSFLAAMGGIADDLLEEADVDLDEPREARTGTFKRNVLVIGAVAAAAAVAVGLTAFFRTPAPSGLPGESAASDTGGATLPDGQTSGAPVPGGKEPTTVPGETTSAGSQNTTDPRNDASARQTTARNPEDETNATGNGRQTETTAPDDSSTRRPTEPTSSQAPTTGKPTQPPTTEKPTQPPTTEKPAQPPAETTTQPPGQSDPGTPGAVFTNVSVGYSEARETFGHPIAPCYDGSFVGYKVGVVSRNGDIHAEGAYCLSVTYEFADGSVSLTDQDRMSGDVVSYSGEQYAYGGRTFRVMEEGYADGLLYVGYYPSGDSGIAYQAVFGEDADVYAIMDLIIELEV